VFKGSLNRLSKRGKLLITFYALCQLIGLTLDLSGVYIISTGLKNWANGDNSSVTTDSENYLQYLVFGSILLFCRSLCTAIANLLVLRRLANEEALIAMENYSQWCTKPLHIRRNTEPSLLKIIFQETPNIRVQMILIKSISALVEVINCFLIFIVIGTSNLYVSIGSIIFYSSIGLLQHRYLSRANLKVGDNNVQSLTKVYDLLDIALRLTDVLEVMPSMSFGANLFESRRKSAISLVESNLLQLLPRLSLELSLFLGLSFVVGFTYFLDSGTSISISLGLFVLLSFRLVPSLSSIQSQISQIQYFLPFLDRDLPHVNEGELSLRYKKLKGEKQNLNNLSNPISSPIRFENVSFEYPDSATPAILDINLDLQKGIIYALVGPNGSGKSTLINLLLGTLSPTTGSIKTSSESEFVVGYVPQSAELFDGSIGQNIALEWNPKFIDYGKILNLYSDLGNSLDSELGIFSQNVSQLSGGQKQLICLIRALFRSPNLLILDEANSLLDDANGKLFDKLTRLNKENRVTLLVSHRSHSVLNADQVILIDKGKVLDLGSVNEVRRRQPNFDDLLTGA